MRAERAEKMLVPLQLFQRPRLSRPNPHMVPGWRQGLKGQLNYLISARGMLCNTSCVWELESTAHGACLQSVSFSRCEQQPYHFRPRGHTCPPTLQCGMTSGQALFYVLENADKLPLLKIPISQGKEITIQWVPTMSWALGIYDFI